jgi:Tfp pilus assembly protein FimT
MAYKNKQISNGVKSFTLVEILIVIGILAILVAMAFPTFRSFRAESDLNDSAGKIISTLRVAQSKTLASEGASQWGVYFSTSTVPHQYTLFQGANYASRVTSSDEIYDLPMSIEIYDINLTGEPEVIFDRLIGSTSQSGSASLRLKTDLTKNQTIYIENSGQVGLITPSVPSDAERMKDSRHVHFDLGWSIQNATTVKFYFPDIPQTEEVDMADYFDVGQTTFDWEGIFVVGGVDQTFRIHTHSLDAFNTFLCIHRDRNEGKNDQEVVIYIVDGGVDKDIAHYLTDTNDTVIEGSYVNEMARQ